MNDPLPSDDAHAALRAALERDAARIEPPPFDPALHYATLRRLRALAESSPSTWMWRSAVVGFAILAAAALCLAFWPSQLGPKLAHSTPPPVVPDFSTLLASNDTAVPAPSSEIWEPLPSWMSPTAPLLDLSLQF